MISYSSNPIVRMKAMIALMLVLTATLAPMAHAQGYNTVQIENSTSYRIDSVYISSASDPNWRGDRLGSGILHPGYVFTTHLPSGYYDLKLVDEDNDTCEVRHVLVSGPTYWRINNSWLLNCEFHR